MTGFVRPRAAPPIRIVRVRAAPPGLGGRFRGRITAGAVTLPCVLGPAGIVRRKREGDGGTPAGCFALLDGRFRPDRQPRPSAPVTLRPMRRSEGWCDDPSSRCYNRPVTLPFPGSHERMWRQDRLYDLVFVLDYNLAPQRRGAGSAIFLHVMPVRETATAGCVALRPGDLCRLLPRLSRSARFCIG